MGLCRVVVLKLTNLCLLLILFSIECQDLLVTCAFAVALGNLCLA